MNFIKKHEILSFYIGTYIFTLLLFFIPTQILPNSSFPFFLLGPAIIALVMVAITSNKNGILSFTKGLIPKKIGIRWILLSFIIPTLLIFLTDIIFHLITNQNIDYTRSLNPINLWYVVIVLIGCIGEELGWRSYLLPLLSKKYNNILSSIIVGLLWGIWHSGDYGEGLGFLLFVVSTICMSIIMTWLYYKGNKSLVTAVIFHTMINLSATYIGYLPSISYRIITAVVFGVLAIILILTSPIFKKISSEYV